MPRPSQSSRAASVTLGADRTSESILTPRPTELARPPVAETDLQAALDGEHEDFAEWLEDVPHGLVPSGERADVTNTEL